MNEAQRQHAWARVHQADVSSAELNYLAGLYPEFLPAISTHPNFAAAQPQPPAAHTADHTAGQAPAAAAKLSSAGINVAAVCALIVAALGALFYFFIPFIVDMLFATNSFDAVDLALNVPMICVALVAAALAVIALRASLPSRGRWAAFAALGASGFQLLAILAQTAGSAIFDAVHYF